MLIDESFIQASKKQSKAIKIVLFDYHWLVGIKLTF